MPVESLRAEPSVRGYLHRPEQPNGEALVLTHGAGSNCEAPLLVAVAETFAAASVLVLRCDLPYRQARAHGPPLGGDAARDREGLRAALEAIRPLATGGRFLGGHSYGGRQSTMLAASDPTVADALLLFSYPLHPPRRPDEKRTAHFPQLQTRALFLHGTRDPFGSIDEMRAALRLIPARTELVVVEGAGHDLGRGARALQQVAMTALTDFRKLVIDPGLVA